MHIDFNKLNKAFKELTEKGYFAKQNFSCCQSCGWAEIDDDKSDKVVFYHQQDNDNLKETGKCYLSWAGDGHVIVEVLNRHGILTNWNCSEDTRIEINLVD
jgi:hypothetical protein